MCHLGIGLESGSWLWREQVNDWVIKPNIYNSGFTTLPQREAQNRRGSPVETAHQVKRIRVAPVNLVFALFQSPAKGCALPGGMAGRQKYRFPLP